MKPLKIILCFLILFTVASCGKNEFMNIYAFTQIYNEHSDNSISISDFCFQKDSNNICTAFVGNGLLLTLNCDENDSINELRLSLIKDKSGTVTTQQTEDFNGTLLNLMCTYCGYDAPEAESVISSFGLNESNSFIKEGELTVKKGNFYFVYYSTSSISQVMIYNTYIYDVEITDKPVSKPYYAEDFIIKETP